MTKKNYPSKSKGTFYPGYKDTQGPSPGERSMQTVRVTQNKPLTAENMRKHGSKSPLTAQNMRKPFG